MRSRSKFRGAPFDILVQPRSMLLYLSSRPVCSLTRRSAPAGETLALFLRGCLVPAQILLLKSKSSCHSLSSIYLDIDCTGFLKDLFS